MAGTGVDFLVEVDQSLHSCDFDKLVSALSKKKGQVLTRQLCAACWLSLELDGGVVDRHGGFSEVLLLLSNFETFWPLGSCDLGAVEKMRQLNTIPMFVQYAT